MSQQIVVSRMHARQPFAISSAAPAVDLNAIEAPSMTDVKNALAQDRPMQLSLVDINASPSLKLQCGAVKSVYFDFASRLTHEEIGCADFLLQNSLDRSFRAALCDYLLDQGIDPSLVAEFYKERAQFLDKDLRTLTVTPSTALEKIQKQYAADKKTLCIRLNLLNTKCTIYDIPLSTIMLQTTDRDALQNIATRFQGFGLFTESFKHTSLILALCQKLFFFCNQHGTHEKPLAVIFNKMYVDTDMRLTKDYFIKLLGLSDLTTDERQEIEDLYTLFKLMEELKISHMKIDMLWALSLDRESFSLPLPITPPIENPLINYRSLFGIWQHQWSIFEGHLQTFIQTVETEKRKIPKKRETFRQIQLCERTLLQMRNCKELNGLRLSVLKKLFAKLPDTERNAKTLNRQMAQYLNWIGFHLSMMSNIDLPATSLLQKILGDFTVHIHIIIHLQYEICQHGILENRALIALSSPDHQVYIDPDCTSKSASVVPSEKEQAVFSSVFQQVSEEITRRPEKKERKEVKETKKVSSSKAQKLDSQESGAAQQEELPAPAHDPAVDYGLLVSTDSIHNESSTDAHATVSRRGSSLESKRNAAASSRDEGASLAASLSLEAPSQGSDIAPQTKSALAALETCQRTMAAVEKGGFKDPLNFIGTITPAMLVLSQRLKEQFLSNPKLESLSPDLCQDYEKAILESCDHLLFLMHDIEFVANSFHHGHYDELSSSMQDFLMDLPISIEQERAANYLLRNKERSRRHSLLRLTDATSGALSEPFQGTIKDFFEAMIWARYPNQSLAKFAKGAPEPLQWHHFAGDLAKAGAVNGLTQKRACDMIDGITRHTLHTLDHFFGKEFAKDPLYQKLTQTLELLRPFLFKSTPMPKKFPAFASTGFKVEMESLAKLDKDIEKVVNSCHRLGSLREGNPLLHLQEVQHHTRRLIAAYRMCDRYRDPRVVCHLVRKLLNMDKTFEQLYRSHCLVLDVGSVQDHNLGTYHEIFNSLGQRGSREDYEHIVSINPGITQHYLHIETGVQSKRVLALLEQSKAALFAANTTVIPEDLIAGLKIGIRLLCEQAAITLPAVKQKNQDFAKQATGMPDGTMIKA